jgi:5-oxoprolinase (ATP-hydrolysing)
VDQQVSGPALIAEATGTILLLPGWCARVLSAGELLLEQQAVAARPPLAAGRRTRALRRPRFEFHTRRLP